MPRPSNVVVTLPRSGPKWLSFCPISDNQISGIHFWRMGSYTLAERPGIVFSRKSGCHFQRWVTTSWAMAYCHQAPSFEARIHYADRWMLSLSSVRSAAPPHSSQHPTAERRRCAAATTRRRRPVLPWVHSGLHLPCRRSAPSKPRKRLTFMPSAPRRWCDSGKPGQGGGAATTRCRHTTHRRRRRRRRPELATKLAGGTQCA